MEKIKKIAAAVLAILLVILIVGGFTAAQIVLWKQNAWYAALPVIALFIYAIGPVLRDVDKLLSYALGKL